MNRVECLSCTNLGRSRTKEKCSGCHRCVEHGKCKCIGCGLCGLRQPPQQMCKMCHRCNKHHIMAGVERFPHRKCDYNIGGRPAATFKLNALERTLGCELEISHPNGFNEHCSEEGPLPWEWTRDRSVEPSGLELVTQRMRGDKFFSVMGQVLALAEDYKCEANATCGFHVHVDAADFNLPTLRRVYVAFAAIQEQLYGTLVKQERRYAGPGGTHYCQPILADPVSLGGIMDLTTKDDIKEWLCGLLYAQTPPRPLSAAAMAQFRAKWLAEGRQAGKGEAFAMEFVENNANNYARNQKQRLLMFNAEIAKRRAHKYENAARRSTLNLHSWMMRGTLEFRLKEGTVDPTEVLNWPLWCGWFVDRTAVLSDKEVCKWIKSPPTLVELVDDWSQKVKLPRGLGEWVREKCANPQIHKPPLKKKSPLANAPQAPTFNEIMEAGARAIAEVRRELPSRGNRLDQWVQYNPGLNRAEQRVEAGNANAAQQRQTMPPPASWDVGAGIGVREELPTPTPMVGGSYTRMVDVAPQPSYWNQRIIWDEATQQYRMSVEPVQVAPATDEDVPF